MRLLELFDKVANYDVLYNNLSYTSQEDRYFRAAFTVGRGTPNQRRIEVNVETFDMIGLMYAAPVEEFHDYLWANFDKNAIFLGLSFESEVPGTAINSLVHAEKTTNITGLGNQYEIMATVIKITQEAISKTNAAAVFFGSIEANRTRVYRAMAKRLGSKQASFEFPSNETVFLVHV